MDIRITVNIPSISEGYYQKVSKPSRNKKRSYNSLEAKRARVERNLLSYYNEEYPNEPLSEADEGLLVLQQGAYPFDMELFFEPQMTSRANAQVIRMPQVQRGFSKVFYSGSYWLQGGKLEKLLDADSVLEDKICNQVAEQFLKTPKNKGVYMLSFGRMTRPYRVYQDKNDLVLMNMLNGLVFRAPREDVSLKKPLGDREHFSLDTMHFRRNGCGGYERY